jgi:hypothetical protein
MKSGERQFHLRLHTSGTRQLAARRLLAQILEQRSLAHTGFAGNHQRPAFTSVNSLEQPVEYAALGVAVNQLHHAPCTREIRRYLHGSEALTIPGDIAERPVRRWAAVRQGWRW